MGFRVMVQGSGLRVFGLGQQGMTKRNPKPLHPKLNL